MSINTDKPELISNIVSGKILVKESGAGIPDLLVILFDIDNWGDPEERSDGALLRQSATGLNTSTNTGFDVSLLFKMGDRIGSTLTDASGEFLFDVIPKDFNLPPKTTEQKPDLVLLVLAPEEPGLDINSRLLYLSNHIRFNAGTRESYIIKLSNELLANKGIFRDNLNQKIQNYREKKDNQKRLKEGIKKINEEFSELESEQKQELRKTLKEAVLPNLSILNSMDNFVKENMDTIEDVQIKVYRKGANQIDGVIDNLDENNPIPGKGIKISLVLTQEEKLALQEYKFLYDEKYYYHIPEDKIRELLFKRETDKGINAILFSNNPISKYCIQKSTDDKCAEMHTGIVPDTGQHQDPDPLIPETAEGATGITTHDIPIFLEKILADKNSSQFQNVVDYKSQRPDPGSVQAKVDSFLLQKGPADTTAYYDFHSLQIAFDYVWHQLLDETLVNLTDKIHNDLENSGKKGLLQSIQERMQGVVSSRKNIMVAVLDDIRWYTQEEVPTEISTAFDITFIEYDALTHDNKIKLASLAKDINYYEAQALSFQATHQDFATLASVLRDQGERIIDNIRINSPYTTNQLLKELQERLLSKYEFTVFAADKDYHSINFGLMNTFRQKWEPLSYQAGKLVKTIPLSPKEERKYSVKTTINSKITRKQAQKYNTSLHQEINTTSRAESEIVAKAHDKSNFNMSVKLDYSKISSQVTFGKDAEKESSQAKKDFREAVMKAVQEYKEERSFEIDTEETFNSEYSESGTIVNPNDELSVTYLFYELQRRYRISEQLYRVMPVVLVAQQVPSPDQITEAWIVAHDWIINRALLDDSFRNTLQYIAQKNVGDNFAIRELRKNLRQQRTLVNTLQIEFSKLKQDVENKYAAMERAVQERITEEHEKRTWKWWWWWNDPNRRPDEPPDPEMAKALEQAATDEHKYAVEKAEKMALSVQREVNALHQLTKDYNDVMREHLDRITQTRRLITHIKENILYYMQAIWSMEPPDQRFMRLYKVMVPYFEATRTCIVEDGVAEDIFAQFREEGKQKYNGWLHGKIARNADGTPKVAYKQLVEVADLDTMLGFKGNYMIFPLKEHNALTELMAAPYIDEAFGAMDPDQLSNINLEEFSKYICCLHHEKPEEYERLKPVLKEWLTQLLADPLRNGDEVIVPTGSLFIEMLPSDKSLLEDFKLKHREWDVYKVQAEVRKMEIENLRFAARLLNNEREDPDVEKKIIVKGGAGPVIDVDNP